MLFTILKAAFENRITEYVGYFVIIHFPFLRLGILKTHGSEEVGKMGMFIFQSENLLGRYYLFPAVVNFINQVIDSFSK